LFTNTALLWHGSVKLTLQKSHLYIVKSSNISTQSIIHLAIDLSIRKQNFFFQCVNFIIAYFNHTKSTYESDSPGYTKTFAHSPHKKPFKNSSKM